MKMYVIGSSLTSCYWNGAATYYRGVYKNLHALGHEITFAEPDIYKRQQNRDCPTIEYADVRVYQRRVIFTQCCPKRVMQISSSNIAVSALTTN